MYPVILGYKTELMHAGFLAAGNIARYFWLYSLVVKDPVCSIIETEVLFYVAFEWG